MSADGGALETARSCVGLTGGFKARPPFPGSDRVSVRCVHGSVSPPCSHSRGILVPALSLQSFVTCGHRGLQLELGQRAQGLLGKGFRVRTGDSTRREIRDECQDEYQVRGREAKGTPRLSHFSLSSLQAALSPGWSHLHRDGSHSFVRGSHFRPPPWAACCPRKLQQDGGRRPWERAGPPTWPGQFCSEPVQQGEPPPQPRWAWVLPAGQRRTFSPSPRVPAGPFQIRPADEPAVKSTRPLTLRVHRGWSPSVASDGALGHAGGRSVFHCSGCSRPSLRGALRRACLRPWEQATLPTAVRFSHRDLPRGSPATVARTGTREVLGDERQGPVIHGL